MKYRVILLAALSLASAGAAADVDHETARQLREQGEIVPLESILERVRSRYAGGTLLEVELEREKGALVYEVELLDASGRVREMLLDARTGEFIGSESETRSTED